MARKDAIEIEGKVVDLLPNTMFRVQLPNGHLVLAHFSRNMSQDKVAVRQLHPKHRVRQEVDHLAFYFNCVFPRHVRISGSSFVIKTVCSKWADGIPSAVQAVQPSSSNLTEQ